MQCRVAQVPRVVAKKKFASKMRSIVSAVKIAQRLEVRYAHKYIPLDFYFFLLLLNILFSNTEQDDNIKCIFFFSLLCCYKFIKTFTEIKNEDN